MSLCTLLSPSLMGDSWELKASAGGIVLELTIRTGPKGTCWNQCYFQAEEQGKWPDFGKRSRKAGAEIPPNECTSQANLPCEW